MTIILKIRHAH